MSEPSPNVDKQKAARAKAREKVRLALLMQALDNIRNVVEGGQPLNITMQATLTSISKLCQHHFARSILKPEHVALAQRLRSKRPTVVPSTNVVVSKKEQDTWFKEVTETMSREQIGSAEAIQAFCDIAGVPN